MARRLGPKLGPRSPLVLSSLSSDLRASGLHGTETEERHLVQDLPEPMARTGPASAAVFQFATMDAARGETDADIGLDPERTLQLCVLLGVDGAGLSPETSSTLQAQKAQKMLFGHSGCKSLVIHKEDSEFKLDDGNQLEQVEFQTSSALRKSNRFITTLHNMLPSLDLYQTPPHFRVPDHVLEYWCRFKFWTSTCFTVLPTYSFSKTLAGEDSRSRPYDTDCHVSLAISPSPQAVNCPFG
ncbi:hypothetical protein DFH27DRAFT_642421 [Peziza echinospora]|nr:hypothetical protein DFH27DRAFT_642421 [Peziza echinospora]